MSNKRSPSVEKTKNSPQIKYGEQIGRHLDNITGNVAQYIGKTGENIKKTFDTRIGITEQFFHALETYPYLRERFFEFIVLAVNEACGNNDELCSSKLKETFATTFNENKLKTPKSSRKASKIESLSSVSVPSTNTSNSLVETSPVASQAASQTSKTSRTSRTSKTPKSLSSLSSVSELAESPKESKLSVVTGIPVKKSSSPAIGIPVNPLYKYPSPQESVRTLFGSPHDPKDKYTEERLKQVKTPKSASKKEK